MMPLAQAPPRGRQREKYERWQVAALNEVFEQTKYIPVMDRQHLANHTGLSIWQIRTWFQNRRQKLKREALQVRHNGAIGNGNGGVGQGSQQQQQVNNNNNNGARWAGNGGEIDNGNNNSRNGDEDEMDVNMDGDGTDEMDEEEKEERAIRNRYKLLSLLPVECWLQIFDGMARCRLARSAASASKLFACIASTRIYGQQVWPQLLQEFYICQENGTTVATYVNVNQAILTLPYMLDLPFPAKLSTSSFTNLKEITICHLDDQVHHFLRAITPFLAGSVLKFSSISSGNPNPNIPAKEVEMFGQWAADVKFKSASIGAEMFTFLHKNCPNLFHSLSSLEIDAFGQQQPCFFDAIVGLLANRTAGNGQQMIILTLNSSAENASKMSKWSAKKRIWLMLE